MEGEILPSGSLVLLSLISISGFFTWWFNNFTQRNELVRIFAIIGIASMISLLVLVFAD
tara:strand:- start:700 stop:876 length:177 start_codon:yes stop_codon:yes gene_type:complete